MTCWQSSRLNLKTLTTYELSPVLDSLSSVLDSQIYNMPVEKSNWRFSNTVLFLGLVASPIPIHWGMKQNNLNITFLLIVELFAD